MSTGSITPSTALANSEENTSLEQLPSWSLLSVDEKAFVAAYVDGNYSVSGASVATGIPVHTCKLMLSKARVRSGITEVQNALGEIDFLNEKWVRTQLLALYPKLVGEESVPMVDNAGLQIEARKFYPEAALKVLEYVAPKALPGKGAGAGAISVKIDMGAMGVQSVEVTDIRNG